MIISGIGIENSSAVFRREVFLDDGSLATTADIDDVTLKVFDADSGDEVEEAPTYTSGDVFYDEPQAWTVNATGFNFEAVVPGEMFPDAGNYRVEFKVSPSDGSPIYIVFDLETQKLFSE